MITKRKAMMVGLAGVLSLIGSALAYAGFQVCFVESFWLHAVVFPINPQTVSQSSSFDQIGALCEFAFSALFLMGLVLVLVSVRFWWLTRSANRLNA